MPTQAFCFVFSNVLIPNTLSFVKLRVFTFDWTSETVGRRLKAKAVAAGVRCTAHDLRRSFCSRLAAEGVPLQIAQRLMRHASPTTTAAYYTNVEDVLHQAVAKV